LIRHRPQGSRVFCIGVGNDVDRSLLNNLADTSGGLAAFISAQDNFDRQAAAFRRKLMHPVASDIKLSFAGGGVYDVEPLQTPNRYLGMPVHVYGRFRNPGQATLVLSATIEGQPLTRTIDVDFPEKDQANPEIERMWAMRRVDRLLAMADATSSPDSAAPEIIRLGECFSIATRYTFIVLENDQEYRRWQIDRRNLDRIGRDRTAQEVVAAQLAKLREKSAADLGPEPTDKLAAAPLPVASTPAPAVDSAPQANPAPNGGGAIDGQFGLIIVALVCLFAISYWRPGKAKISDAFESN
jgi:Ca-activated chloride channel family protein